MKKNLFDFAEIMRICREDNYLMIVLKRYLMLIKTVNENYQHVVELECLVKVLKSGLDSYYKEFHPNQDKIVRFCAAVAENTRRKKYPGNKVDYDLYDVLAEIEPRGLDVSAVTDMYNQVCYKL